MFLIFFLMQCLDSFSSTFPFFRLEPSEPFQITQHFPDIFLFWLFGVFFGLGYFFFFLNQTCSPVSLKITDGTAILPHCLSIIWHSLHCLNSLLFIESV